MSDELMLQSPRPSALPYAVGGMAVGAGAGIGLAKLANFGIKTPAYESWEEAVAAANKGDKFIKKQAEGTGDNAKDWKLIQEQGDKVKAAEEKVNTIVGELDREESFTNYTNKLAEVDKAEEDALSNLLKGETKLGEGEKAKTLLSTVMEATSGDDKALADKMLEDFKNDPANKNKKFKIGDKEVKIKNLTAEQAKELQEFKEFAETNKNFIERAKKVDVYTKIRTEAKSSIEELEKKVKEINKDFDFKKYNEAVGNHNAAKKEAAEKLTKDLLKNCKKPNALYTALIGAGVGLSALLLRPKAKDDLV